MARNVFPRVLFAIALSISCTLSAAGTVHLPAYPLAVRSPWLSAWAKGDVANDMTTAGATFWTGDSLGWEIMARVDGEAYILFGLPDGVDGATTAFQTNISFTSTHTTVTFNAGAAEVTLDFFSPVSPLNLLRHSLPYSYLTITAVAQDLDIQIYSAIDEAWSGQIGNVTTSRLDVNGTSMYIMENPNEITYEVYSNMARWGSVVYATETSSTSSLSFQCGEASDVHDAFIGNGGILQETSPTCSGGQTAIFAYSHNLGQLSGSAAVTFAIGQSREELVEYIGQPQASYHQAQYPTIPGAVAAFFDDYNDALAEAVSLDAQIRTKAGKLSSNYADIAEASVRQAFAAMEVTIPRSTLNTSNPMVFLKEISSDANVNTIDVIYPTFPILYELAPKWIKYLMEPVLAYLVSPGAWNLTYMVHDIGDKYPIANGHNLDQNEVFFHRPELMPLESTGITMVLLYAYQTATGDKSFAQKYGELLHIYADFLCTNGTATESQLTTVDAVNMTSDQTMLVVQSAIGLVAYGAMFGEDNYKKHGLGFADMMYTQGKGLDTSRTHFTFHYGSAAEEDTWSVMFPFFADKLLKLNTFPSGAYDMMSTWYSSHFETYGLPYGQANNTFRFGVTDWNMWAAATSSDAVRQKVIDTTHAFLTLDTNTKPFQTKYDVSTGNAIANIARSTVGSNFALMNLDEVAATKASTVEGVTSAASGCLRERNPVGRLLGFLWLGKGTRSRR